MPNQSRERKKLSKAKAPHKKKCASPGKRREMRDQTRNNDFASMSKAHSVQHLPRVAQLQRRQSHPSAQENAQLYYMGKDGEILSGQYPPAPSLASRISSQEDRSQSDEPEEAREEPFVGNVFQAFWMTVSKLFHSKPASSVDVGAADRKGAPSQSSSTEDHRPCSSNDLKRRVTGNPMGPNDWRRSSLGRSASQTSGPLAREAWRRRQDGFTFSSCDQRVTYGSGIYSRTGRTPKVSKEELVAQREIRVKKSGSPVDSKKFRVVLTKFQNVLKEESKRLGIEPRLTAHGLNRAKSLVVDPPGSFNTGRPSSYGPQSLSSVNQRENELNKGNFRASSYSARRNAFAARSAAVSDRAKISSVPTSLNTDTPQLEALESISRTKGTQIALANMQRFRGVNVRSNEAQCDECSSPCKAEVRNPDSGKMSSCQTDAELFERSLKQFNEAYVQFPSSSESTRDVPPSEAEISDLSFGM